MNVEECVIESLNRLIARQNNAYIRWLDNSKRLKKNGKPKRLRKAC